MTEKQVSIEDVYEKLVSIESFIKNFQERIEDLEFSNRTESAWQEIEQGNYKEYGSSEDFLESLRENAKGSRE